MNHSALTQKLSIRDKSRAAGIGLLIPIVEVWLRKSSFRKTQKGLQKLALFLPAKRRKLDELETGHNIANVVDLGIQRYSIYPADCLVRSLVLQYVLSRYRIVSELILGVRNMTGQFEAHAWVEVDNTPLNEREAVQSIYTTFDWSATRKRASRS